MRLVPVGRIGNPSYELDLRRIGNPSYGRGTDWQSVLRAGCGRIGNPSYGLDVDGLAIRPTGWMWDGLAIRPTVTAADRSDAPYRRTLGPQ